MAASLQETGSGGLQICEGGGAISVFGLPFLAAGVFAVFGGIGIVPIRNAGDVSTLARPVLLLMGVVFTAVGGGLVFGRKRTTIEPGERTITREWRALLSLRREVLPLDEYTAVAINFVRGDSDTVDKFPVVLKARSGKDVQLYNPTTYADARASAVAVARHLRLEVEDATTDHTVRQNYDQADRSFSSRQFSTAQEPAVARPAGARCQVTRDAERVQIVMPGPRSHPIAIAAGLLPLVIPAVATPTLLGFFRQTRTPEPIAWTFLGLLIVGFGVLPALSVVSRILRSRRSATIVYVSRQGIAVMERGIWRTRSTASLDAGDILDVDFSTRESAAASARRAAEQQARQGHGDAATPIGPRTERLLLALARFARGGGIIVKTSSGFTTFGEGLDDEEIRYLHSTIRRALHGAMPAADAPA